MRKASPTPPPAPRPSPLAHRHSPGKPGWRAAASAGAVLQQPSVRSLCPLLCCSQSPGAGLGGGVTGQPPPGPSPRRHPQLGPRAAGGGAVPTGRLGAGAQAGLEHDSHRWKGSAGFPRWLLTKSRRSPTEEEGEGERPQQTHRRWPRGMGQAGCTKLPPTLGSHFLGPGTQDTDPSCWEVTLVPSMGPRPSAGPEQGPPLPPPPGPHPAAASLRLRSPSRAALSLQELQPGAAARCGGGELWMALCPERMGAGGQAPLGQPDKHPTRSAGSEPAACTPQAPAPPSPGPQPGGASWAQRPYLSRWGGRSPAGCSGRGTAPSGPPGPGQAALSGQREPSCAPGPTVAGPHPGQTTGPEQVEVPATPVCAPLPPHPVHTDFCFRHKARPLVP